MKKFLIIYITMTIILALVLYFVTLVTVRTSRYEEVKHELSEQAGETNDFEAFVKFFSLAYREIDIIELDFYTIHVFHLLSREQGVTFNQLAIIVRANQEVDYASSLDDTNDQTSIVINNLDNTSVYYESKEDPNYPMGISYGIELYDFYFFAPRISHSIHLEYELFDYDGDLIYSSTIDFMLETYDLDNLGDFQSSYTEQELEELIKMSSHFPQALVQNYTVFTLSALIFGFLIIQVKKKKWAQKQL